LHSVRLSFGLNKAKIFFGNEMSVNVDRARRRAGPPRSDTGTLSRFCYIGALLNRILLSNL